eukprot:4564655-Amphidinium_carterae.1
MVLGLSNTTLIVFGYMLSWASTRSSHEITCNNSLRRGNFGSMSRIITVYFDPPSFFPLFARLDDETESFIQGWQLDKTVCGHATSQPTGWSTAFHTSRVVSCKCHGELCEVMCMQVTSALRMSINVTFEVP